MSAADRQDAPPAAGHSVLSVLAGLLLVAGLAGALFWAWNRPEAVGRYEVQRAYKLLGEGRYTEAADLLENLLLTYPDPETRLALSFAYLARRDTVRAERQARLAAASSRLDMRPAGYAQLGRILQLEGRWDEAFEAWQAAQEAAEPFRGIPRIEADRRSALWHTAMLRWAQGNWEAAQLALEPLAQGDDLYSRSARLKLAQLLGPNEPDRAERLLRGLPAVASAGVPPAPLSSPTSVPDLRVPGLQEGVSPDESARLAAGLQDALRDAAGVGDGDKGMYLQVWGAAYLQQGEPALAKRYLSQATGLKPTSADAHARLGLALFALGRLKAAMDELQTAARLDPSLPLVHHVPAQIYTRQRQWEAAQREFDALLKFEPKSAVLQLELGDFYRLQGRYSEAEAAYKEATRLPKEPGGANAQLALARFYIDVLGEGCASGLAPAQASLEAHPGEPASLDAVGWALALCGSPLEAAMPLERAVQAAPDVPRYTDTTSAGCTPPWAAQVTHVSSTPACLTTTPTAPCLARRSRRWRNYPISDRSCGFACVRGTRAAGSCRPRRLSPDRPVARLFVEWLGGPGRR